MSDRFVLEQRMQYGFFDFDETLVKENTFHLLCKSLGSKTKLSKALLSGAIEGHKQGDIRQGIRLSMYRNALAKSDKSAFFEAASAIGPALHWNELIVQSLLDLKEQGAEIVVITASPRIFVEKIIQETDLPVDKVLGSELVFHDDKFSGLLLGKECVKREKVNRLVSIIPAKRIESKSVAFGNLPDDGPMLERSAIGISVSKTSGVALEVSTRKEFGGCRFHEGARDNSH